MIPFSYNITVPTTWDEFSTAAAALHKADPKVYLSNFTSDQGWFFGMLWQSGAKPFLVNGTNLTVNFTSPEALRVAKLWGDMMTAGVLSSHRHLHQRLEHSHWQHNMLILYAAMKAVPSELYEAARVDGANEWQLAWNIRIPLVMPAILLTFIFSIIGTLQLFNEPNVLNAVAPTAMNTHFTPNLYVFSLAFRNKQFDYSAAISFTLALVTAVVSSLVLFVIFRREAKQ